MTDLRRTPDLHRLLQSVLDGHVVHHCGNCGPWPRGWSWSEGGHMTDESQRDMDDLWHARLVTFKVPADPCGNAVLILTAGRERLTQWDNRWPVGGVA